MATGQAPFTRTERRSTQPVATAGNDLSTVAAVAPFDGTITAVTYTTPTAITGANTNSRTVALTNKGQAGSGTAVPATLALVSGVNTTASVPKTITLSSTASDLVVAAGDVLVWSSTHVGTGIADTGGLLSITFSRNV